MDPATDALVERVNGWIKECELKHELCKSTVAFSTPKRLLHIDGDAHLIHTAEPVRYAALSYCWDGYSEHRTESSNVAMRHSKLEVHNLPQTLKDAIWFALKLGINYIWIDSLCIVQDDWQDWVEEAAKIADIYSAAYVVLSATCAKDATKGFQGHHTKPHNISSHFSARQSVIATAWQGCHYSGTPIFDDSPLDQRGWCLQESLLAIRIMHFLPSEVIFSCKC